MSSDYIHIPAVNFSPSFFENHNPNFISIGLCESRIPPIFIDRNVIIYNDNLPFSINEKSYFIKSIFWNFSCFEDFENYFYNNFFNGSESCFGIIAINSDGRYSIKIGEFTKEDVKQRKVNLTFFGNFHKMELEDFQEGMTEMMNDRDYLYKSLMKDLYF